MIDLDKLPTFNGFGLYDRNTGSPITAIDIPELKDEDLSANGLFLADDGYVYADSVCGGEMPRVKRSGRYILQIGIEMYRY